LKLQTNTLVQTLCLLLGLVALSACGVSAAEQNFWPFWVGQTAGETDAPTTSWSAVGPFFFHTPLPSREAPNQTAGGFRPFYVEKSNPDGKSTSSYFLYPVFSYHTTPYGNRWSFLNLINSYRADGQPAQGTATASSNGQNQTQPGGFDLWPIYFSRDTGDPATSYHAVFPIYGTIHKRFGLDHLSWTLFPIYTRAEKHNVTTTAVLWPFFRTIAGEDNHGFTFWPLFGWRAKEGAYHEQFYLWPLVYKDEQALWQKQPAVSFGILPFYASYTSPEVTRKTFVGPFFGYTDRVSPVRYHETSYFWPLFVQGRGDQTYVNRWGPFYTHSVRKGIDKTWVLWPLWCHKTWNESGLHQTQNRFIWFIWNSNIQQSAKNPNLPPARKTHLWPLVSYWNNGAGQKQIQALSLFSSLFPYNEPIQLSWDPLFAIYRYDQAAPNDKKYTLLWNLISWRRSPTQREFHLGPLFSIDKGAAKNRVAIGCGLIGWKREDPESRWRLFFFDFKRRSTKTAPTQP
jgi:hypothetical protein